MGNLFSGGQVKARGKVVLVTGCSKGGIGFALAEEYHRRGATVYATSRKVETMGGLEEQGIHVLPMDVTSEVSIQSAVKEIETREGGIDILVNNAGMSMAGPSVQTPIDLWKKVYDTNVFGAVAVSQAVVPIMAPRKWGRILNVGSVAGILHRPWNAVYSSSKAALHCVTNCMRMELKPLGIDVILVAPGYIKTNIFSNCLSNIPQLPRDSPFAPYEHLYRGLYKQKTEDPKNTPVEVFVDQVVDTSLRRHPPWRLVAGTISTSALLISSLPMRLRDIIMWKTYSTISRDKFP